MCFSKKLKIDLFKSGIFLFSIFYFLVSNPYLAYSISPQDLRQTIDQKAKELQQVNDQIQDTQKNLSELGGKNKTLKQELKKFDYQIRQVDLNIKSSQINIEKLNLEIEALQYDISDAEQGINDKKEAIIQTLRELQLRLAENIMIIILRNKSLAESIAESQNLSDLNNSLAIKIAALKNLKDELDNKLNQVSAKKVIKQTEKNNLENRKIITKESKQDRQRLLAMTQNQERLFQQYIDELEEKQTEIAAEIEKLEVELRAKIDPASLPVPRPGVLAWPVTGQLSQEYGETAFAKKSGIYKEKWHNGIDIAAPVGTAVVAAENGKVIAVGNTDDYCRRGAYGKFVVIEHENNLTTFYAHLSRYIVVRGDIIKRGDLIGYIGNTGRSTGPHLHFTVYSAATFDIRPSKVCGFLPSGGDLNPMKYL